MKKIAALFFAAVLALCLFGCEDKITDNYGLVVVKGGTFSASDIEAWKSVQVKSAEDADAESADAENAADAEFSFAVGDFMIGAYEVTQELYNSIMASDGVANAQPSYFDGEPVGEEVQEQRPVENVSWYDCVYFCNKLSELEGLEPVYSISNVEWSSSSSIHGATVYADFSKSGYRLPTYAEWVWAAIGGTKEGAGMRKYAGEGGVSEIAWTSANAAEMTHQVGLKQPNELGLYDMTGNVCEWCHDYFWQEFENQNYTDYRGPDAGTFCYMVGGSFAESEDRLALPCEITEKPIGAVRGFKSWSLGFRLARNIPPKKK